MCIHIYIYVYIYVYYVYVYTHTRATGDLPPRLDALILRSMVLFAPARSLGAGKTGP